VLFNSYVFLFGFLPATLAAYLFASRTSPRLGSVVLVLASVFFYGWWNPAYVPLLLASAAFNYMMSRGVARAQAHRRPAAAKAVLIATIAADLALLGYYKYYAFLLATLDTVAGAHFAAAPVALPLGISFFTFTQIAFVVDTYRAEAREHDPLYYLLFVTWFPHLIAGPIIHHRETMPQFAKPVVRFDWLAMAAGSAMFTMGLFKKVVLADGIAYYVSPANAMSAFTKAGVGVHVGFFDGWASALAYTLQLYFDFSGYSDMAIGLSFIFGVRFPANFDSPYKARNIIEFWRRWHITLSRFLRDYLYVPLGGNRHGVIRRYVNLLITMLLGGLWHGAGWTFVAWGALHGIYLVINHAWRSLRAVLGADLSQSTRLGRIAARTFTFIAVVVGWVFFRATTFRSAVEILSGMAGVNGFTLAAADRGALGSLASWLARAGVRFEPAMQMSMLPVGTWIVCLLVVVQWMPNSQEIMRHFSVILEGARDRERRAASGIAWRPSMGWALVAALLFTVALLSLTKPSEFLYYQF
jgi:alginate O-acetyltransferase complex protein AlgI